MYRIAERRKTGSAGSYRKDILFKRYVSLSCTVSCTVCRSSDSHVQHFCNALTSPSQVSPMTCFRRKGKSFVHTAPRIRSAVFRIHTGFPCSAEQECVSIYVSGSRICHKVSRIYRKPPIGGGSLLPNTSSVPKRGGIGAINYRKGEQPAVLFKICARGITQIM